MPAVFVFYLLLHHYTVGAFVYLGRRSWLTWVLLCVADVWVHARRESRGGWSIFLPAGPAWTADPPGRHESRSARRLIS
ncbi:hypothetical protein FMEAI12_3640070 [Parafrankia sp. Ea1.12]|nr:hypothetical protein FMEAI12_3640070 [Parafrankia sp. Ea1.12]